MIRAGLPDHDAVVHDMIAEGDKVTTRKSFTGNHRGDLFGVQPTGKRATMNVIDIVRVRDGEIAEHWNVIDLFGLMQQLGAISQSPSAESDTVCYGFQITDLIEHGSDPRPDLGELLESVAAGRWPLPRSGRCDLSAVESRRRPPAAGGPGRSRQGPAHDEPAQEDR